MRLLTHHTAEGPAAAIQVDDTLVPASAVEAPASTVRGLLEALDGDGLRELAARADALQRRQRPRPTASKPPVDERKAIDTFAPCGPAIVTRDEIDDLATLELRTRINSEVLQRGTTANLIFGPAELIACLSRTITLLPGDIIATGTPAGVGAAQGRFLRDGDTVEVEIDGLGTLVNPVRSE
jgi:2-keto-4-pentenoate hydratase/2-oxohepta-3-ene-1,7-dioic acid hydratase in catechol pathway